MSLKFPTIFLNHGGGPLPLLNDRAHANLVRHLKSLANTIPRPRMILLSSAHWETEVITLIGSAEPKLLYDYYGFPPESYSIEYPAKNSPDLVTKCRDFLRKAGISTAFDAQRGYDHGVFVPLKLMYPEGDIPVVQVSLPISRNPELVYEIGKALKSLREEGVLILGSGLSFHNLSAFFQSDCVKSSRSNQFDKALKEACLHSESRRADLMRWSSFPHSRYCHPTDDHLMPLLFAAGAADGEPCKIIYEDDLMGAKISGFQFGV
jgi:4,5-DOPA dioxygenase extradiol